MASRIVKSPSVQATAKRQFAQAAVARTEREFVKAEPLKVSTLPDGLTVASIENHSPVTTLGVVIKAGARNEGHDNAGVSHALRIASVMATKKNTAFNICRNIQQVGGNMSCTQGREHTLYAVQTTRDQAEVGVDYLTDSVSNSVYKPWEVERSLPRLKLDLATRSPATQALELLHQAAFRTGLGNSLYSPGHKVGSHGTAVIKQFVSKHFTSGRAAILGVRISHQALTKYAELLKLESGSGPSNVAPKFAASEQRVETLGGMAYVAVGAQTGGAVNVAASGVCQTYSDAGLIGALVVSEAESAGKAVSAVVSALRGASVTDDQVAGAKNQLLADVYTILEDPLQMVENMGMQLLVSGDVMPVEKYPEIIKAISTADVQAAAKKLAGSKLAMGAVGNLATVPYLDSL